MNMTPTGESWRVTIATLTIYKIPVDPQVASIPPSMLTDLYWLAGSADERFAPYGWWPVYNIEQELDQWMKLDLNQEILTLHNEQGNQYIEQRFVIVPWTAEEIATYKAAQVQKFKFDTIVELEKRLDEFAATKSYKDATTAASYALGTDPEYKAEGLKVIQLREQTWRAFFDYFQLVFIYEVEIPASVDDIPNLPELTWE
jgi:hypothetical protein